MSTKISKQLNDRLEKTNASDLLDVVIELRGRVEAATESLSRNEKIAALKEAFTRNVAPVEDAVGRIGGVVTGQAWINQTVRARVPADRVRELSEHEQIKVLDAPHPIERESSK